MTRFPTALALVRELADHDDRQLLDIGLVRAADGSLRRADSPVQDALATSTSASFVAALSEAARSLLRAVRAVPFHSSASGPVILTAELAA